MLGGAHAASSMAARLVNKKIRNARMIVSVLCGENRSIGIGRSVSAIVIFADHLFYQQNDGDVKKVS
jgi:Ran GTPase-activating protein (RanGAP) involved in mRNA processing and transport